VPAIFCRPCRRLPAIGNERQFDIASGNVMDADWEHLESDLVRLKRNAALLREKCGELGEAEIEALLGPLRGCMVELIALRSSLEKVKADRSEPRGTP
jgi:hypothetical protein